MPPLPANRHALYLGDIVALPHVVRYYASELFIIINRTLKRRAWGSVVVKALRYKSEGPGIDSRCRRFFFPWHLTDPCALGPTPLKSEYQDIPGGKGGRCVRLTTYHLHVPIVKKSGGLNLLEPCGPVQACNGTALPRSLYPRERPGTHFIGGWVGPRAGLDGCGKFLPRRDSIPSLGQPVASCDTD